MASDVKGMDSEDVFSESAIRGHRPEDVDQADNVLRSGLPRQVQPAHVPRSDGGLLPHLNGGTYLTLSLDEILDASVEACYYACGFFVAGSEPGPPLDDKGNLFERVRRVGRVQGGVSGHR